MLAHAPQLLPLPLQWVLVELAVDAQPSPPTPLQCSCLALQLLMMAHAPQWLPLPLQWVLVELAVDAQPASPPTPLQCSCPALQLMMLAHAPQWLPSGCHCSGTAFGLSW